MRTTRSSQCNGFWSWYVSLYGAYFRYSVRSWVGLILSKAWMYISQVGRLLVTASEVSYSCFVVHRIHPVPSQKAWHACKIWRGWYFGTFVLHPKTCCPQLIRMPSTPIESDRNYCRKRSNLHVRPSYFKEKWPITGMTCTKQDMAHCIDYSKYNPRRCNGRCSLKWCGTYSWDCQYARQCTGRTQLGMGWTPGLEYFLDSSWYRTSVEPMNLYIYLNFCSL